VSGNVWDRLVEKAREEAASEVMETEDSESPTEGSNDIWEPQRAHDWDRATRTDEPELEARGDIWDPARARTWDKGSSKREEWQSDPRAKPYADDAYDWESSRDDDPWRPRRTLRREEEPPTRSVQLFEEGLACVREGDQEGALAAWEMAAELDPDNRVVEKNLAKLRKMMGIEED
jgi:hypothetical protein